MRRAQFDKPIFFILALVIVAMVLYVGYMGINALIKIQEEREVRAFWNDLDRAASRNMNSGAEETINLYLPRSVDICFFNVDEEDKKCEIYLPSPPALTSNEENEYAQGLAGYDTCLKYLQYWSLTSSEAESDNIILSSGRTHRNDRIQPANGKYQCFSGTRISVLIEGRGRHVTIAPAG